MGDTPLVRLGHVAREAPSVEVYAKLEFANPGGSVKDRAALRMMPTALADGRLAPDKILIDSTSGNTGVAYSLFGAALGVRVALVMPVQREQGAQGHRPRLRHRDHLQRSDGRLRRRDPPGARARRRRDPEKYFYPDQYSNPDNPLAHYHGTGAEILDARRRPHHALRRGLGTSGTIMGTSRRLREHSRPIRCVAVEPADALHGLEGLKHLPSSLVPAIHDARGYDETLRVDDRGRLGHERPPRPRGGAPRRALGGAPTSSPRCRIAKKLHAAGEGGCIVAIVAGSRRPLLRADEVGEASISGRFVRTLR